MGRYFRGDPRDRVTLSQCVMDREREDASAGLSRERGTAGYNRYMIPELQMAPLCATAAAAEFAAGIAADFVAGIAADFATDSAAETAAETAAAVRCVVQGLQLKLCYFGSGLV